MLLHNQAADYAALVCTGLEAEVQSSRTEAVLAELVDRRG